MLLRNKVAVVTGGGGTIGEGICICLAQAGAHVVVSDIHEQAAQKVAAKIKNMGCETIVVSTDVRMVDQCRDLIAKSRDALGSLDILVCAAGVSGFELSCADGKPSIIENITEEEWELTIDVNLKGVFLCNQAVAPHFKQQNRGKIINISSIGGRKGVDFIPHYSASKAGVIVFSQALALQLAPFNIQVNTICPGLIWTPMWEKGAQALSDTFPHFKQMAPKEIFDAMVSQVIPLQRPQSAKDIGKAVAFLASGDADQITGQALNIDGGAVLS